MHDKFTQLVDVKQPTAVQVFVGLHEQLPTIKLLYLAFIFL